MSFVKIDRLKYVKSRNKMQIALECGSTSMRILANLNRAANLTLANDLNLATLTLANFLNPGKVLGAFQDNKR